MKSARISLLLVIGAVGCLPTSNAQIITVPADHPTMLGAIDAASHSDGLIVVAGTYERGWPLSRQEIPVCPQPHMVKARNPPGITSLWENPQGGVNSTAPAELSPATSPAGSSAAHET